MNTDTSKKRILIIAPFPPPVHGAAVVSQQIRNSNLINERFLCDYVNLSTSRQLDEIGEGAAVKLWRALRALHLLFWKLVSQKYDLCYLAITCHGKGFLKDFPFVLLCRCFGRRILIHQHNKGMTKDVNRWPYKWLFPLAYNKAHVILLSDRLYEDISQVVPHERVLVCPNGIAVSERECPRRNPDSRRILFLSNLIESKGIWVLLDALKILSDRGVCFFCDIIGSETREINVKRLKEEIAARELESVITYHGQKLGKDKDRFMDEADIFTFPTFYDNETFGLVNLEAMAHYLPIVTTDEGGIPDVVKNGENGIICKAQDPVSLADCILYLLLHPEERIRMGKNGYRILQETFTEKAFEERLYNIFNDCTRP